MSGVAQRLREAADLAERAAVYRQHAEWHGARGNPTLVGSLDRAADLLRAAAATLGSPSPPYGQRALAKARWMIGLQVVAVVAMLWAAPDPASPWVLALAFAGSGLLAKALTDTLFALRDRRAFRSDPEPAPPEPGWEAMLAQLQAMLKPIDAVQVDDARAWLDRAQEALPGPEKGN